MKSPIAQEAILKKIEALGKAVPPSWASLAGHELIRTLRIMLGMTQAQLGRRCHKPQSYIALLEQGKVDCKMGTFQKICQALLCDVLIIPKPRKKISQIVQDRIKQAARRNIERLAGTMSLENQKPEEAVLAHLLAEEERRLRQSGSSEIWSA